MSSIQGVFMYLINVKKPDKYLIHISKLDDSNSAMCNSAITLPTWKTTNSVDESKICGLCAEKLANKKKYEGWTQDMYDEAYRKRCEVSAEMYKKEREAMRAIHCFTKE